MLHMERFITVTINQAIHNNNSNVYMYPVVHQGLFFRP